MEAGAQVMEHAHESFQVTIVLKGSIKLGVENSGETILKPGEYIVIPPRTKHWALASETAVILDINAPFTEDRRKLVEKLGGCKDSAQHYT